MRHRNLRLAQAFKGLQTGRPVWIEMQQFHPWQCEAILEACSDIQDGPRARVDVSAGTILELWKAVQEATGTGGKLAKEVSDVHS
jgi:hypothetical protein